MTRNIIGLFDSATDAQATLSDLRGAGFDNDRISFAANNANNQYGTYDSSTDGSATGGTATGEPGMFDKEGNGLDAGEGAGFGATSGAVMGGLAGLLAGIGAIAIPGIGPTVASGWLSTTLGSTLLGAGLGAATGGVIGALVGAGIPEGDAQVYAESLRRGGSMITVNANSDDEASRAIEIMRAHNVVDIDRRGEEFRQSGWTGFDSKSGEYTGERVDTKRTADTHQHATANKSGEMKVPVVEETLNVQKREVESGGVRVFTRVEETPVQEQVTLRQEHVNVERTAVNRPVSGADMDALKEGTVEVRERSEQAVVNKEARVVEEVTINKEVDQRVETISDTVRRTDVEVEQIPGETRTVGSTDTTTHAHTDMTGGGEGAIERGVSKAGNAVERGLGADLDADGDVGKRDTRNNY